jgi:hypothetical protein
MPTPGVFAKQVNVAVAGTGAVTILAASGNASTYRDIVGLSISTINGAAGTLTISDGNNITTLVLNYPNAAAVPGGPLAFNFDPALQQTLPNKAWTITASVNASGYNVNVQYTER